LGIFWMHDREFKILVLVRTYFLFSRNDEISITPWTFIDKNSVVVTKLGSMTREWWRTKGISRIVSQHLNLCVCAFVCLFMCCTSVHLMWEHSNDGNSKGILMSTRSWKMWLLICEGTIIFFIKLMRHFCQHWRFWLSVWELC